MRYLALVSDYDGTIAHDGRVDEHTIDALERCRASGRRLVLVTGRELPDLIEVFPRLDLFDRVVVENGAVVYTPATREERALCSPPRPEFVEALRERDVDPLSVGRVIVATWEPNETKVLDAIHALGLEYQIIFNKGAVMVLPSGVNKAFGLQAALSELELSPHNAIGVGDAENDHAFLNVCEASVAVANALDALKDSCDLVTEGARGGGVVELVDHLLESDLADLEPRLTRHHLLLGSRDGDEEVRLQPCGVNVLVAGPSGSGKSTVATSFLEQLVEHGYQYCIVDPEGDYEGLAHAVVLGDAERPPGIEEVLDVLARPEENVVVNMLGIPLDDRPGFFEGFFARLQQLRARTARPHWVLVDEAHHLLPSAWHPAGVTFPRRLTGILLITVHPEHVSRAILSSVTTVIAVGADPSATLRSFAESLDGSVSPGAAPAELESGQAVVWAVRDGDDPRAYRVEPPHQALHRHRRKYAEGELGPDKSFYFTGPDGRLNLRAQNLVLFLQLAEGVDDDTWEHHLRRFDYSAWVGESIKDAALAQEITAVEEDESLSPAESRARIRAAIQQRYTVPA